MNVGNSPVLAIYFLGGKGVNQGTWHMTPKPAKQKVVQKGVVAFAFQQQTISSKIINVGEKNQQQQQKTGDEILWAKREAAEMRLRNAEQLSGAIIYLFIKFSSIVDWSENNRTFMKHEAFPKLSIKVK